MITKEQAEQQIKRFIELQEQIKKLEQEKEFIKKNVESYMKDNQLTTYIDSDKNVAQIIGATRESIDKKKLPEFLTQEQIAEVTNKTSYSFIKIQSPDSLANQRRFLNQ